MTRADAWIHFMAAAMHRNGVTYAYQEAARAMELFDKLFEAADPNDSDHPADTFWERVSTAPQTRGDHG